MPDISLNLVLQTNQEKKNSDMTKVVIKYEDITPFEEYL